MAPINWTPQDDLVIARSECHWMMASMILSKTFFVTEKQLRKRVKELKYKTYKNLVYTLSGELWGPEGKEKKDEKFLDLVEKQERMRIRNREEKMLAFINDSDALLQEYKTVNSKLVAEKKRLEAENSDLRIELASRSSRDDKTVEPLKFVNEEIQKITDRLSKNKKRGSSERSRDGPSRVKKTKREAAQRRDGGERESGRNMLSIDGN